MNDAGDVPGQVDCENLRYIGNWVPLLLPNADGVGSKVHHFAGLQACAEAHHSAERMYAANTHTHIHYYAHTLLPQCCVWR